METVFSLTLSVLDNRTELNINSFMYLELLLDQFLYRVGVTEVIIAFRRKKNRSESKTDQGYHQNQLQLHHRKIRISLRRCNVDC